MGDKITDLALSTFAGAEDADDHAKRHDYYRTLAAKQAAGQKLAPHEQDWMAKAKQAIAQHQPDDLEVKTALTPVDNKAKAPKIQEYDSRTLTPEGHYAVGVGSLPNTSDWMAFKQGAAGLGPKPETLLPNAPVEPVPAKKPSYILPADVTSYDEMGRTVDSRGRKHGFADVETDNYRMLDRRPADVSVEDHDKFANDTFERLYGKHVDAVEANGGDYPTGYFRGMAPEKKADIKAGVKEVLRRRRGNRT